MKNFEIKAKYQDHDKLKKLLRKIGARFIIKMRQTDTYFSVPKGRLKLREHGVQKAVLLYYQRNEQGTKRWSDYYKYSISDPNEFKKFMERMFPVKVVVDKERALYRYKNARIHIDKVGKLGNFMEIEVEVKNGKNQAERLMKELIGHLDIPSRNLIKNSYSDMLMKKIGARRG